MSPKTPPIQQGLGLKSDTQTEGLEWSREKKQVTLHDYSILKDMQHARICKHRVKKKGPGTTAMLITCVYVLCAEKLRIHMDTGPV